MLQRLLSPGPRVPHKLDRSRDLLPQSYDYTPNTYPIAYLAGHPATRHLLRESRLHEADYTPAGGDREGMYMKEH